MIGKYLVWAALGLGFIGFFLPMLTVTSGPVKVSLSGMDLMGDPASIIKKATDQAGDQVGASEGDKKKIAAAAKSSTAGADLSGAADKIKSAILILFAPTILFLIVTLMGFKMRYGRGLATLVLLGGLAGALVAGALSGESSPNGEFGMGMTMILIGGVAGIGAGIMGLIKPEPKAEAGGAVAAAA